MRLFLPPIMRLFAISSKVLQTDHDTAAVHARSTHNIVGTICGSRNFTSVEFPLAKSSELRLGFNTADRDGIDNNLSIRSETIEVLAPEAAAMATAPRAPSGLRDLERPCVGRRLTLGCKLSRSLSALPYFSAKTAACALGFSAMLNILIT